MESAARLVTIALAQFAMGADPSQNLLTAERLVREGAARGASLIALPELFHSPYFCVEERCPRDYAEAVPGELGKALGKLAQECRVALVAGSVYEKAEDGQRYNTSMVFDSAGQLCGKYRKTHIPHDPAFFERNYFTEGNTGFQVFDCGVAKVAVLICYDQWFPEAARAVALAGAEIILYPTAIGVVDSIPQTEGPWQDAWETVQRGHAIANNVVVGAINRVGREGATTFWGGSFICDAFGVVRARGGADEELVVATIDLAHSIRTREGWRFFCKPQTADVSGPE